MEKRQILGFSGCAILLIGGFLPLFSARSAKSLCAYEMPFFYIGVYLALILASAYLLWRKNYKPVALTAILTPLPILYCILNAMSAGGLFSARVWGLLFKVSDYGWLVLLAGVVLLLAASGFRRRDGLKGLIPKDFSPGAASPATAPPPPVGMTATAAAAPPPPVGAMPPPPPRSQPPNPRQSVTPAAEATQTCVHCQAAMNPSAKFCRACGTPVTQVAAAPSGPVCQHCQAPLSATARFCRACGAPATPPVAANPAVCPRCGVGLEPDERFCSGCGQQIAPA